MIFRYFNVAGADPDSEVGEFHQPETHLVPLMLDAIDGKRDAHLLGLKWLSDGKPSDVFNLGTGTGFSVREVAEYSKAVTNKAVPVIEGARRAGDCTRLVSGSNKAEDTLGWTPQRSNLKAMISDAWRWHQTGHYSK